MPVNETESILQLIGTREQITASLNAFNPAYHADFFRVRNLAKTYLAFPPSQATTSALADALYAVLGNWGAGLREAPLRHSPAHIATTLMDTDLHERLVSLEVAHLSALGIDDTHSRAILDRRSFSTPAGFDELLLGTLGALAKGLFLNNTNVTYPMKALLLITGLMPALDGQVRRGLKRAGFRGVDKTQFLLPADTSRADGRKVCDLAYFVAQCWRDNAAVLQEAIIRSNYPALISEPGRIFDVLLFMQQDEHQPQILIKGSRQTLAA